MRQRERKRVREKEKLLPEYALEKKIVHISRRTIKIKRDKIYQHTKHLLAKRTELIA